MAKFYQVGGSVRDKFLNVKSKDIDYAVEAESFDDMRDAIVKRGGKIYVETPKYFTIRAFVPDLGATDYTLCRKDGIYKDGRHPENVTIGTIQDDLARRDFTMNAIAIDTDTQEILDPFNGQKDILIKNIRCVGNPIERFNEDKLRIIRAIRFAITKQMSIDRDTDSAMLKYQSKDFNSVSTERIREELLKMFTTNTWRSFQWVHEYIPELGHLITERGIWFKPTVETI